MSLWSRLKSDNQTIHEQSVEDCNYVCQRQLKNILYYLPISYWDHNTLGCNTYIYLAYNMGISYSLNQWTHPYWIARLVIRLSSLCCTPEYSEWFSAYWGFAEPIATLKRSVLDFCSFDSVGVRAWGIYKVWKLFTSKKHDAWIVQGAMLAGSGQPGLWECQLQRWRARLQLFPQLSNTNEHQKLIFIVNIWHWLGFILHSMRLWRLM